MEESLRAEMNRKAESREAEDQDPEKQEAQSRKAEKEKAEKEKAEKEKAENEKTESWETESREAESQEAGLLLEAYFDLPSRSWEQYSPLTLAYIGDAVYDLIVRTVLVKRANMQTAKLHQKASGLVKAGTQAELITALLPYLTEEETGIYRRGHNAKPYNTAKNASRRTYLEATGFEALMGYLYLKKEYRRMLELIRRGLKESGHEL